MLLKPCKVKRFLTTAALSEVGLVTASSDSEEKWQDGNRQERRKTESYIRNKTNREERRRETASLFSVSASVSPFPVGFGEQEEVTSKL